MTCKFLICSVVLTIISTILLLSTFVLDQRLIGLFFTDLALRLGIEGNPTVIMELSIWSFLFLIKVGLVVGVGGTLSIWISQRFFGKNRTDAILTNLTVLGTTIVILLIIGEFAVRLAFIDITTTGDNTSYFSRRWNKNRSSVRLNTWRFREQEFELAKPDGIYRIAVIGDSITFGQGIEEEDRFTNLLGKYLNEKNNKYRYEVLNFGRPGAETIDHIVVLKDLVLKANPDFILLQWFINDFEGHDKSGRPKFMPLLPVKQLHFILHRSSALYYLINQQWNSLQELLALSGSYDEYMFRRFGNPKSSESREAIQALKDFIDLCNYQKTPLGIVLFPRIANLGKDYPLEYLHNRVLDICTHEGITCIDLRSTYAPLLHNGEFKKLWVNQFDAHPGPLANHLVASRLMEVFETIWLSIALDDK